MAATEGEAQMGDLQHCDSDPDRDGSGGLSKRDARILEFERSWWQHVGAKEEAIRLEFDLSPARYYQLLRTLTDSPAALVHDPMLIKRLQRLRDARAEAKASRLSGRTD